MTPEEIIKRFGGYREMAAVLEYAPSTVHNWLARKRIPESQQGIILLHAQKMDLGIIAEDLIRMPKKLRKHKSAFVSTPAST